MVIITETIIYNKTMEMGMEMETLETIMEVIMDLIILALVTVAQMAIPIQEI